MSFPFSYIVMNWLKINPQLQLIVGLFICFYLLKYLVFFCSIFANNYNFYLIKEMDICGYPFHLILNSNYKNKTSITH